MIHVMLNAKNISHNWWVEVANTAMHITNGVNLRSMMDKTTYEI